MKIFKLLPVAAISLLAVSCQNGGGTLSESSTQTDSLMYYLGQMNAGDYLRQAVGDTAMKEASAKQAYLAGVKTGLSVLRDGDENYNKGVMMGVQMAGNIIRFAEEMEVNVDEQAYVGSLRAALEADTMPNNQKVQSEFRRIMNEIETAKKEKDKKMSQESLAQEAQKADLPKINDDLYGKVTDKTDGEAFEEGQEVQTEIEISKVNGETIRVPFPNKGKLGNARNFPTVITDAIYSMKNGESGEFMSSAHALFGARTQQMDLKPLDILKIKLKATLVPQEENKEENK